jgi:tyrosyl-tRNA synthetase
LTREEIAALEAQTKNAPEKREAQRVLATHVSRLVHGDEDAARVERANAVLFAATITNAAGDEARTLADSLVAIAGDVPSTMMAAAEFDGPGASVVDLVVRCGLAGSKSEARRLVQQGGVSVNDRRLTDPAARVMRPAAIDGRVVLLKKGARQRHVIVLT